MPLSEGAVKLVRGAVVVAAGAALLCLFDLGLRFLLSDDPLRFDWRP
jgi:hypothetical protein